MNHSFKGFYSLLIAGVLFLALMAGCGGGGGSGSTVESSGDSGNNNDVNNSTPFKVNAPTSDVPAVLVGFSSPTTITAFITPTTAIPSKVMLYRLDPNTNIKEEIGELRDDGANGDITAGDHVYSIQVSFTETLAGSINLRIGVIDATEVISDIFTIPIFNVTDIHTATEYKSEIDAAFNNLLSLRDSLATLNTLTTSTTEDNSDFLTQSNNVVTSSALAYANFIALKKADMQSVAQTIPTMKSVAGLYKSSAATDWICAIPILGKACTIIDIGKEGDSALNMAEIVKANGNDSRIPAELRTFIKDCAGLTDAEMEAQEYDANRGYCFMRAPSGFKKTMQNMAEIGTKFELSQVAGGTTDAAGKLITNSIAGEIAFQTAADYTVDKAIDWYVDSNGQEKIRISEIPVTQSLSVPIGTHNVVVPYAGSDTGRTIIETVAISQNNATAISISPSPFVSQSSGGGKAGDTISQWGTGFTPNSTATLYFKKPDGTEYPPFAQVIDGNGKFSIDYTIPTDKPTGSYSWWWWAVDGPSGKKSNIITYTIYATPAPIPRLRWPLSGIAANRTITLGFDKNWTWGYCGGLPKKHTGIDLTAAVGESVYASDAGTVKAVYNAGDNWGKGIVIDHGVFATTYMHVDPLVSEGLPVTKGQKIATIADINGFHLHYNVRKGAYSDIAKRGALPQVSAIDNSYCQDDPIFPENFINPITLTYNYSSDTTASPPPTIASIDPPSANKGSTVQFTLTGTGFQSGFTAKLINELGTEYSVSSTQYVSSTSVKVTVYLGDGPTSTQKIKVINPDGQSMQISFTAQEPTPAPTISSITPNSVTKGQSATFTLTGTGFQSGFTAKLINELGTEYNVSSTQFISSSSITVTAYLGSGSTSTQKIKIINPDGQSTQINFTALGNVTSAPTISSISPSSANKGMTATFTLTGTGFQSGFSAQLINEVGTAYDIASSSTQFVSDQQVKVTVYLGSGTTSTQAIKIINPDSQSAQINFTAIGDLSSAPTISSISPSSITKGQTVIFTLTGTNFQNGFTAKLINELGTEYNASSTQFISSTSVKVTVYLGSGTTSTQTIKIINPDNQSTSINFSAVGDISSAPSISSISPSSTTKGQAVTFTLTGNNLQSGFTAKLINELGTEYSVSSTQFIGSTSVKVTVYLGSGTTSTQTIKIINSDNQSAQISFTAVGDILPAPSISSIDPSSATKGQTVTFTLSGSNFQSGFSGKLINELGTEYSVSSTQYVSSTSVKVTVYLGSGQTSTQAIKIINPDGQSAQISFTATGDILPALTISSISPSSVTKGTTVTFTLTGNNFQSGFTASIINELGTEYPIASSSTSFVSSTSVKITVYLGSGATSTQKIKIVNPDGQGAQISFTALAG